MKERLKGGGGGKRGWMVWDELVATESSDGRLHVGEKGKAHIKYLLVWDSRGEG